MSDVTFEMKDKKMQVHQSFAEEWKVPLVDTGELTQTGGRLKQILPYVKDDECFCFTYGDGVSDLNISKLIEFHRSNKTLATLTAAQLPGRFGALRMDNDKVTSFHEKPQGDGGWINGGFFVLSPKALDYVNDNDTIWEKEPVEKLAADGQMSVYRHSGFWQCMDTLRDKEHLERLWADGDAPWKTW
jgi:glucose-1-phosphate cytidylyltransferase